MEFVINPDKNLDPDAAYGILDAASLVGLHFLPLWTFPDSGPHQIRESSQYCRAERGSRFSSEVGLTPIVICLNADRRRCVGRIVRAPVDWVHAVLRACAYEHGTFYFPSGGAFLFFLARLLDVS